MPRTHRHHIMFADRDGAILLRNGRGDHFQAFVIEEADVDLAIEELQKLRKHWQETGNTDIPVD